MEDIRRTKEWLSKLKLNEDDIVHGKNKESQDMDSNNLSEASERLDSEQILIAHRLPMVDE